VPTTAFVTRTERKSPGLNVIESVVSEHVLPPVTVQVSVPVGATPLTSTVTVSACAAVNVVVENAKRFVTVNVVFAGPHVSPECDEAEAD
jgi:hypothetical protein